LSRSLTAFDVNSDRVAREVSQSNVETVHRLSICSAKLKKSDEGEEMEENNVKNYIYVFWSGGGENLSALGLAICEERSSFWERYFGEKVNPWEVKEVKQ
jgi:hypothetical protein